MTRPAYGFTFIGLMIVIAILLAIAALAVPHLVPGRPRVNESAAVATLRSLASAQAQFRKRGKADADKDGTGEFGGFLELSGAGPGRMAGALNPPVLSGAFRTLNADGAVSRSGYLFHFYLPGAGGAGVGEPMAGYRDDDTLDSDLAETTWCCYAWPVTYKQSGNRVFFINQAGEVTATEDPAYSGPGAANQPASDAAFQSAGRITGRPAIGVAGQDGNIWRRVR